MGCDGPARVGVSMRPSPELPIQIHFYVRTMRLTLLTSSVRRAMEPGRSGTATLKRTRRPSAASPRSITAQKSAVEANVDGNDRKRQELYNCHQPLPMTGMSMFPPQRRHTTFLPFRSSSLPASRAARPVAPAPSTMAGRRQSIERSGSYSLERHLG